MTSACKRLAASIATIVFGLAASAAAQATATIAGTVKDTGGGIVPGATITLISESRGTTIDGLSGATGDFVLTNLPGDTYTVRVTMDGFKTTERNVQMDGTWFDLDTIQKRNFQCATLREMWYLALSRPTRRLRNCAEASKGIYP